MISVFLSYCNDKSETKLENKNFIKLGQALPAATSDRPRWLSLD